MHIDIISAGWFLLSIFAASLGFTFIVYSLRNRNKGMLMFGISFITSSLCYILIGSGYKDSFPQIYQWSGLPIMIAIFVSATGTIFHTEKFKELFDSFLISITLLFVLFILVPKDAFLFLHLIRMSFATLIVGMLIFLAVRDRNLTSFLFLFAISSYTVAGISLHMGYSSLSIFSYLMGYVFISLISFFRYEESSPYGIDSFLNLKRELESTKRELSRIAREQRTILENIPSMVYLKDEKNRFVRVNNAFCRFLCENLNVNGKDIIGKRANDILPKNVAYLFSDDKDIMADGKPLINIVRSIDIGKKKIWLKMDKIPLKENGKLRGLVGIATDISESVEKEEMIRESREKFRILSESAPFAIIVFQDEKIVYANRSTEKITGYGKKEILEMKFWEMVHPDFREMVKIRGLKRQSGEYIPPYEIKIITKNGEERWVRITGNRIIWNNRPAGIVTTVDITEIKEAERALRESEKKFRLLAENSPMDVLVIQDGKFVYVNFDIGKVTGYSREELLSMGFLDIVHPDFRDITMKKYKTLAEGKKTKPIECKIYSKSGEEKWVIISGSPIEWDGRRSVLVVVSDITDRKRAEEEAIEAKRYMEHILHATGDGIRIIGLDYKVKMLNKKMARMASIRMREGIGMNCSEMFGSKYCDTENCSLKRVLRTGKGFQIESLRIRRDGKEIPCLQSVTPLKDSEGNIVGIIEDFRDITMVKRAEERLRRAHEMLKKKKEQLERLNNLKTLFLNITSHELRTPMSAIRGYAQLLTLEALGKIDREQKKALQTIIRNIDRLDKLINDILDVSRLESGTLKITPERCRIEKIIDDAVETMRGSAEMKGIKINIMIEHNIPDLFLDKYRIEQVIVNLLNNAIKFSDRNSRIIVRARRERDRVVLEVQDFGRGIPKNRINKIFEPFYQVDSGMDRKFGGAGLGLTIVKGIVEAHGGDVEVESKVGEGSIFRIILPVSYVKKERKIKIFSME